MAKPFTVEDLYPHQKVLELAGSPDGSRVACTVRSVNRENDEYLSCIWSLSVDGSSTRQLTRGPGRDQSPRWSPDGRQLAFLSDRSGSAQVHLLPADGGEAAPLGKLPGAVSELRWLPDAKALVVSAAVTVDPDWRGERANGRQPRERKVDVEVAWKLPYKSDGIGSTAELVLYPGEDHHFLGEGAPSVRQDACERIIDWVSRHVQEAPPPLPAGEDAQAPQDTRSTQD